MAPPRGRRRKAAAPKPSKPLPDSETVVEQVQVETENVATSINPKLKDLIGEQIEKNSSIMDIDNLALQSSENSGLVQTATDVDSQLLYEGDAADQDFSYAPDDVDALLGEDDNEVLYETEGTESVAVEDAKLDISEDTNSANQIIDDTAEETGEAVNTETSEAKAKAKLVKTTYHYVTDKPEDNRGTYLLKAC